MAILSDEEMLQMDKDNAKADPARWVNNYADSCRDTNQTFDALWAAEMTGLSLDHVNQICDDDADRRREEHEGIHYELAETGERSLRESSEIKRLYPEARHLAELAEAVCMSQRALRSAVVRQFIHDSKVTA